VKALWSKRAFVNRDGRSTVSLRPTRDSLWLETPRVMRARPVAFGPPTGVCASDLCDHGPPREPAVACNLADRLALSPAAADKFVIYDQECPNPRRVRLYPLHLRVTVPRNLRWPTARFNMPRRGADSWATLGAGADRADGHGPNWPAID